MSCWLSRDRRVGLVSNWQIDSLKNPMILLSPLSPSALWFANVLTPNPFNPRRPIVHLHLRDRRSYFMMHKARDPNSIQFWCVTAKKFIFFLFLESQTSFFLTTVITNYVFFLLSITHSPSSDLTPVLPAAFSFDGFTLVLQSTASFFLLSRWPNYSDEDWIL